TPTPGVWGGGSCPTTRPRSSCGPSRPRTVASTPARPPTSWGQPHAPRDVRVEVTPSSPVHEGWEVTLSCRESSNPPPFAYAWSLGGRALPHHKAQVRLWPINATDGGAYTCQATNSLGKATSPPTTLEVYCEWGKMAAAGGVKGRRGGQDGWGVVRMVVGWSRWRWGGSRWRWSWPRWRCGGQDGWSRPPAPPSASTPTPPAP
uniref:Ig-like domain-containing protein n=1 Tax=Strix occidentalis caurina TaxID=311401 RepID=A0A8D0FM79_STROC